MTPEEKLQAIAGTLSGMLVILSCIAPPNSNLQSHIKALQRDADNMAHGVWDFDEED